MRYADDPQRAVRTSACKNHYTPPEMSNPGVKALRKRDFDVRFSRTKVLARSSYPIEPSICSSIRRFISTAYSIGSCLMIGSMNPLTISFEASSSLMPCVIR